MIVFPPGFVPTKYHGYFWHLDKKQLFSIKVSGTLKPLKLLKPNRWNHLPSPGYLVSDNGIKRFLSLTTLNKLTLCDGMVPLAAGVKI